MDKWVEILVTSDDIEAVIIRDILENEDIEVVVRSGKISPYPVNIGPLGEIRILVREADLDRSRKAIEAMKGGDYEEEI